jgi:hypothetical protein
LAAKTGIEAGTVLQAAHFADIARVGIQLGQLKRARIQTLDQLRTCATKKLRRDMPANVSDQDITTISRRRPMLETAVKC